MTFELLEVKGSVRDSGVPVDLFYICRLPVSGSSSGHGAMETDQVLRAHLLQPYGSEVWVPFPLKRRAWGECKLCMVIFVSSMLSLEGLPLCHFQTGHSLGSPEEAG